MDQFLLQTCHETRHERGCDIHYEFVLNKLLNLFLVQCYKVLWIQNINASKKTNWNNLDLQNFYRLLNLSLFSECETRQRKAREFQKPIKIVRHKVVLIVFPSTLDDLHFTYINKPESEFSHRTRVKSTNFDFNTVEKFQKYQVYSVLE